VDITIKWDYTDGDNVFRGNAAKLDHVAGVLRAVNPGQERHLDFAIAAPIVIPLKFVDPAGNPLSDIEAAIQQDHTVWGTSMRSGTDGRVECRGLPAGVTFQIAARVREPQWMDVGKSEPFIGTPGQTLPELVIVCWHKGGIEGVLFNAAGEPVVNTEIGCTAILDDGTAMPPVSAFTDQDGSFVISYALPRDTYRAVAVGYIRERQVECGTVEDVEIPAGTIVNLGIIKCEPVISVEDAAKMQQE
jgi:hypothetical protein